VSARLLDRLAALHPGASRRSLRGWLAAGRVRVDGRVERRGDTAVAEQARVRLGPPAPPPMPRGVRVIHEDDEVIVVDKPPGLLTIAAAHEPARTLYRAVTAYARATARGGRAPRVFVVHRLDRETSGLVVFARTPAVKRVLQAQFAARTVERVYVAIVEGVVRADAGRLVSRLRDDAPGGRVRPGPDGREAVTRYRTVARERDRTVLELTLVTGRRGQIRSQLAEAGHPIVGDHAYGSRHDPYHRLCLHACRLAFRDAAGRQRQFTSEASFRVDR
jgi:23S rRNA pseudouridine1911/1915/1917 synthase